MAKASPGPKILDWPKLATFFDLRSTPDNVPWGRWRYVLNMMVIDGTFQRRCGWHKYGHWQTYPDNADLYDKLVPTAGLVPIDSLYQHTHPTGQRRLFAATKFNIYSQSHDGVWNDLGAYLEGARFQFASVGTRIFVTNDADQPLYHNLDEEGDADGKAFHAIPSLTKIGVTRAGMIGSWQGILFLGNVEMDSVRVGHRIIWSDRENPLEFEPLVTSVAGFQDLDPGEIVLAGVPMADAFFIFTTRGIWRATLVGGAFLLNFQQVYVNRTGVGCLMASGSLSVWRNTAVYFSSDGVYMFNAFATAPEQPAWLYHATKNISIIDSAKCRSVVSGLRASYGEVWFSFPAFDAVTNNRSIVLNMDYEAADEVDHGFTALLAISPDDSIEVAEWMISAGGCSSAEVEETFPGSTEGRPPVPADPKSLEEFCNNPTNFPVCDECPQLERFIAASAADGALKDIDLLYYAREQHNTVTGVVEVLGYSSRFVTGALHWGRTDWTRLENVLLDAIVFPSDAPRDLNLAISVSGTPVDILSPVCRAKSFVLKPRTLECPGTDAAELNPTAHFRWPVLTENRYTYLDFSMAAVTGGKFQVTRIAVGLMPSANSTA